MNWIQRKVHLYNVTFGLYMLDWWERYLFTQLWLFELSSPGNSTAGDSLSIASIPLLEYGANVIGVNDILVIVLMWFIFHNSSKYITDLCTSDFKCLVTSPRERMKSIFHGVA